MAPNRLIHEKSPYLLQHAHNPVDWYPWSDEAFERSKAEHKPIFLSIGYATCHWCHVMEKESFENPTAASCLNDTFICIKVDREERPDIDSVYMQACQMLSGRGGWPLTIFMTPDKKPFFAATYIPVTGRPGQSGLIELCRKVKHMWKNQHEQIMKSAQALTGSMKSAFEFSPSEGICPSVFDRAYLDIERRFDALHGGFHPAPKFPLGHRLQFLLRYYLHSGNPSALEMVEKTLTAIRFGGIWDHVGLGFHRYSTDQQWLLPHFEKMLYDQALMSIVYMETFQVTRNPFYAACAEDIFTYVLRDLTSETGGFLAAEDADSEGEEGRFYLWHLDQIRQVLGEKVSSLWENVLNLHPDGNFCDESTGLKTGANILHLKSPLSQWAGKLNLEEVQLIREWAQVREHLYTARNLRPRPLKDDKILTGWNGLMVSALAQGGRILQVPRYTCAARQAARFILTRMQDQQGRLLHRFRIDEAAICATADDYAFFITGLVQLYQSTFDPFYLKQAVQLQHQMISDFWDNQQSGFFMASRLSQDLPVRPKELFDGPLPSANSVALSNLIFLARMTGNPDWEKRAQELILAFGGTVQSDPSQYTQFLIGLDFALNPGAELVIAGEPDAADTRRMLSILNQHFIPRSTVILKSKRHGNQLAKIAPFTGRIAPLDGKATAFVCQQFSCRQPTTDADELLNLVLGKEPPA